MISLRILIGIIILNLNSFNCSISNVTSTYKIYTQKNVNAAFKSGKAIRLITGITFPQECTTRCHFIRICKTAVYETTTLKCILYEYLAEVSDLESSPNFNVYSKISNCI
jgi:hypothetical protein